MRVAINATTLPPPMSGEDTAFVLGLLPWLQACDKELGVVLLTRPSNHEVFAPWERLCIEDVSGPDAAGLWPYTRGLERGFASCNADVLLTPLHCAPEKAPAPVVLWSFGLYGWDEPASLLQMRRKSAQRRISRACASAKAILAPSEFVRRGLLDGFGAAMDKVYAVRFGVDPRLREASESCVAPPFLLSGGPGALAGHGEMLLQTHRRLLDDYPHTLVVVGGAMDGEPADWGPGVLRFEQIPGPQLAGLYQHCAVSVFPVTTNCAGMAIAEALSAGAVVVTSKTGGIAEVAGEAPLYYNADTPASLLATIRRALREEPEQRERRVRAGKAAVADLTWDKCAAKTYQVLRRAIRR